MTFVKTHLHTSIAAVALALGALSAPANATIATPFGGISAGGFGLPSGNFANGHDFGISTPFGGVWGPGFGIGNGGPGAGGYYTGFGVSSPWGSVSTPFFGLNEQQALSVKTPFGGFYGPGFGINVGPFSGNFGGFGLPGRGADFSVSTPFGGFSGPGFGIGMPCGFIGPCMPIPAGFGLGPQQALSVSTPWGGASVPGFGICGIFICNPTLGLNNAQNVGLSTPFGGIYGPGFGVSTPWGGVSTPFFGLNGQPAAAAPQVIPVMVPYPVPMQGPMGAQGGAQPTQCMINAVPALTKSVDDCEKAGGSVPPTRTSAVQEAKKE